ncbi:MFS general substrate transporter [Hesseltinella vesiculosa]|uniref:MFS general substrate transporter n=1 Tax=Hesseltinella vesiculosa TaxID=101127 RepID=A0A1X2GBP6_9FUNG|nr:MFS general substrate transporter [Hesseltinella vesiculosa]
MAIGTVLSPLGLILASFATQLWHIYLAQGLLFGIGCGLAFAPSLALPSQYFTRNRSLATGIAVAGSGVGGVSLSPMITQLIQTIGYRDAIRVLGAFGFGILVIATSLAFSKFRPASSGHGYFSSMVDIKLLSHDFNVLLVFCFLVPFGYLGPYFLAPQYATYLGYDATTGANLVSIMSGLNSVSRITMGFLADRFGKLNTMVVTTILAGVIPMVVWQFSYTYGVFVVFCVLYGFTSSVFVSLLPPTLAQVVGVENIQRAIGMSYMMTFFGSLVGPPLIGVLMQNYGWTAAIQFSGAPTIAGGLVILYLRMRHSKGKLFMVI